MFSYSTVREARVHNFKVTLIFRVIQTSILAYVIGCVKNSLISFERFLLVYTFLSSIRWNIVRNKGYQVVDDVSSAVTTKVKGVGFVVNKANQQVPTLINDKFAATYGERYRLLDVGDYIIPPIQDSSVSA